MVVRFLPEFAPDGTVLPMVAGQDARGPIFTNFFMEKMEFYLGATNKYHGIVRPSDPGFRDLDDINLPFVGLYITLKSMIKKNQLPDNLYREANQLFVKPENTSAPLVNPRDVAVGQCLVLERNGQQCNPPVHAVLLMTTNAIKGLQDCLISADKYGIDVFAPASGVPLKFETVPSNGNFTAFNVTPVLDSQGAPKTMPLDVELCRKMWSPWETILKYHTYDELVHKMVSAYGAPLVALHRGYRERMQALGLVDSNGQVVTRVSTTTTMAQPVPVPPSQQTAGFGPPKPVAAPAAPVPAPVAGGWGAVKPVAPTAVPTPTPSAPAASPQAAADELQAAFSKLLESQKTK